MILLLLAIILFCVYECGPESKKTRLVLTPAIITAATADFLLVLWIIIYFTAIYQHPKVFYKPINFEGDDDFDENNSHPN